MISKDNKAKAIALTQVNKNDVGSPQAQVSVLTARIKEVTDFESYKAVVAKLGLRK